MKKISLSIAAAAVLAMTTASFAVAAELPSYEKAGLPVSAVQLQVTGAENVQQASPALHRKVPRPLRRDHQRQRSSLHCTHAALRKFTTVDAKYAPHVRTSNTSEDDMKQECVQ